MTNLDKKDWDIFEPTERQGESLFTFDWAGTLMILAFVGAFALVALRIASYG